ncbi:MAG: MaoC/PaaZ C-terminal domain-containing protein [Armatimonadota bacterium]
MRFDVSKLGAWSREYEFTIEADHLRAYAAATNDEGPVYAAGRLAPPVYAYVPSIEAVSAAMDLAVPREDRRWGLHGKQDIVFHEAIVAGMVLRTRATPVGVHRKASGTALVIKTETRDQSGRLVNEQYGTAFFPGVRDGSSGGDVAPDHRFPQDARKTDAFARVVAGIALDQAYRYAEASGDRSPIHLDADFARSVGLPGIILHGMCTMAMTGRAVVETACAGDPTRLKRLAVRFSHPVLPGQEITTHIWTAGARDGHALYAFETLNAMKKAVIRDGLAEVAG